MDSTTWLLIFIAAVGWSFVALLVGLLLGKTIKFRDQQIPREELSDQLSADRDAPGGSTRAAPAGPTKQR
jgi:hypothetical protein